MFCFVGTMFCFDLYCIVLVIDAFRSELQLLDQDNIARHRAHEVNYTYEASTVVVSMQLVSFDQDLGCLELADKYIISPPRPRTEQLQSFRLRR
jgi:hypothetical protein